MLHLQTDDNQTGFAPGAAIEGEVGWQLSEAPGKAFLRLFWYTEGIGTQDVGIAEEIDLGHGGPSHNQRFQFQAPYEPYSFSGQLITLQWAIELVLDGGDQMERIEITICPWTEAPKLEKVPDDNKGPRAAMRFG